MWEKTSVDIVLELIRDTRTETGHDIRLGASFLLEFADVVPHGDPFYRNAKSHPTDTYTQPTEALLVMYHEIISPLYTLVRNYLDPRVPLREVWFGRNAAVVRFSAQCGWLITGSMRLEPLYHILHFICDLRITHGFGIQITPSAAARLLRLDENRVEAWVNVTERMLLRHSKLVDPLIEFVTTHAIDTVGVREVCLADSRVMVEFSRENGFRISV